MRPADGKMMKLVQYNIADEGEKAQEGSTEVIHNHELNVDNMSDLTA